MNYDESCTFRFQSIWKRQLACLSRTIIREMTMRRDYKQHSTVMLDLHQDWVYT